MTKEDDFKLLKIQTCVLKVNIHCDGCKQKVKKLLQRMEGVYQVHVDADQQKVTVTSGVDPATLIKKLARAGKHAELCSQRTTQNQKQKNGCIKDDKNQNQGPKAAMIKGMEGKNQQEASAFCAEEDDCLVDDEEEDELAFIREQMNQLNLLRQQGADHNSVKKGVGANAAAQNNVQMNRVRIGMGGKEGNSNLNMAMKSTPGGIDQRTMAALKMDNALVSGGGNISIGEDKGANDIGTMMSLAGFNGNGGKVGSATVLGGDPNGLGALQVQSLAGYPGSSAAATLPSGVLSTGSYPSPLLMNMHGYNNQQSPYMMNMNMQARHAMQQQPQVMYHRSSYVPPITGYHYNYNPASYCYSEPQPQYYTHGNHSAAHMFSDDDTSNRCSIM